MRKRKALLTGLLVVAMTAGSVAYGSTPSSTDTETGGASDANLPQDVTLTLWTDQSINTDAWQTQFARFADEYKNYNYSLDIEAFAGSDRATKMAAAISSNSLPDMGLYAWFTDTDWCHEGHVLDVSEITGSVKDKMYDSVYEETRLNGKSYMVPLWSNYWTIIYNADLLKAAGAGEYVGDDPNEISIWTIDEFNDILEKVSKSMSGNQYCLPVCTADNQADTTNLMWLTMYGGKLWKDGYSNAGNDEQVIKGLEAVGNWSEKGYTNSDIVSKSNNDVPSDFTNQLTAFSYGYYSNYTDYKSQMEDGSIDTFDIRIAAFPKNIDGEDTYQVANYVYGISAFDTGDSDRETVTKLFLNWLVNDIDAMKETCMAVSSLESIAMDSTVIADNPIFESYNKYIDADHINLFHGNVAGYVSTRPMLFPQLQAYFGGQASAKDALTEYMNEANASIQEYMDNSVILNS